MATERLAVAVRLAVVAAGAFAVQHGLDFAIEAQSAGRAVPGLNRRRPPRAAAVYFARRTGVLPLVAADARGGFARHGRVPGSHLLLGLAFGVQRLHEDRRVGRHAEQGGAVFVDRHGAQDPLHVPAAFVARGRGVAVARVAEVVRADAEGLDRAARITAQAVALIDVGQVDQCRRVCCGIDVRGDDRRHGPRRSGMGVM